MCVCEVLYLAGREGERKKGDIMMGSLLLDEGGSFMYPSSLFFLSSKVQVPISPPPTPKRVFLARLIPFRLQPSMKY